MQWFSFLTQVVVAVDSDKSLINISLFPSSKPTNQTNPSGWSVAVVLVSDVERSTTDETKKITGKNNNCHFM
jgi:hypothetical protein